MLPIFSPRRTKYLPKTQRVSLGGLPATLSRRGESRGHAREPQFISLRNPLWNDSYFVPGRAKPHSYCSSYPTMSPPQISQLGYRKDFQFTQTKPISPNPFLIPQKLAQLQTFHLTLPMLIISIRETFTFRQCSDRRSTTGTITLGVAQPTSTLTTQPSLHYVQEGRAKYARRHRLVRSSSLATRNHFFPSSFWGNP